MFLLHPQLERDTFPVADLSLCRLLLMNNNLFPWLVLVPCIENVREITDLTKEDQHTLMDEIALVSEIIKKLFLPYKINVAALGNQVEQLHIHVIGRFKEDAAWPNPVWGKGQESYKDAKPLIEKLKATLPDSL